MISFTNKDIKNIEILGDILRDKRKSLNIDLDFASKSLMIDKSYLTAFESSEYHKLPSDTYSLQYLKKYGGFLKLDYLKLKELYLKEKDLFLKAGDFKPKDSVNFTLKKKISPLYFLILPKIWRNIIIASIILSIFIYFGWTVKKMYTPPFLDISSPENNYVTSKRNIEIVGQTQKEVTILINGQEVLSDQNGNFNKSIDLQKGINIIKISAFTKHSRENVEYRKVMVE